jgi:hypothetical protein
MHDAEPSMTAEIVVVTGGDAVIGCLARQQEL